MNLEIVGHPNNVVTDRWDYAQKLLAAGHKLISVCRPAHSDTANYELATPTISLPFLQRLKGTK
jgi:hypothetical protein